MEPTDHPITEAKVRLEFILVIGIVFICHSIFVSGTSNKLKGGGGVFLSAFVTPVLVALHTIPTFIVVGLLYWWLYAF